MPRERWDKHAILAEVHRRGKTLVQLCRDAGIEESSCKVALHRPHKAGERAIADFLGVDVANLWPERYCDPTSRKKSATKCGCESSPNDTRDADSTGRFGCTCGQGDAFGLTKGATA